MSELFQPHSTLAVTPIIGRTRLAGGQCIFKRHGSNRRVNLGVIPTGEFTPNLEEYEQYTQEFGDRRLIGTWPVTKDGTLALTLESWTEETYEMLFMSTKNYLVQSAAATPDPVVFESVRAGDIYRIPGVGATVVSVTDGALENPEALTAGIHYTFHKATGYLQVIALPEGFGTTVEVDYTLPAITADDGLLDLGLMDSSGVRGEVSIVNIVADSSRGIGSETIFWDVEFRPSGAVPFFGTQEANQAPLNGRVYATSNHGVSKAFGQIRTFGSLK